MFLVLDLVPAASSGAALGWAGGLAGSAGAMLDVSGAGAGEALGKPVSGRLLGSFAGAAAVPILTVGGSGGFSIVTRVRLCHQRIAPRAAAVLAMPSTTTRRRERPAVDEVATQSEFVFFAL